MVVLDETHVRDVKLTYNRVWVINITEIIPKDHLRVLEEGPKTVGMAVPRRPQMREQSTARRTIDAPSKGVVTGDLTMGGKISFPSTVANDGGL